MYFWFYYYVNVAYIWFKKGFYNAMQRTWTFMCPFGDSDVCEEYRNEAQVREFAEFFFSLSLLIIVIDGIFVAWCITVWIVEQFENAAQHRIGVQSGALPFTQTIETPRVDACECVLWLVALILSLLLLCVYVAQLGLLHAVSRRPARVSTRTASVRAQQISQTQATRRSWTQYVRSCLFCP